MPLKLIRRVIVALFLSLCFTNFLYAGVGGKGKDTSGSTIKEEQGSAIQEQVFGVFGRGSGNTGSNRGVWDSFQDTNLVINALRMELQNFINHASTIQYVQSNTVNGHYSIDIDGNNLRNQLLFAKDQAQAFLNAINSLPANSELYNVTVASMKSGTYRDSYFTSSGKIADSDTALYGGFAYGQTDQPGTVVNGTVRDINWSWVHGSIGNGYVGTINPHRGNYSFARDSSAVRNVTVSGAPTEKVETTSTSSSKTIVTGSGYKISTHNHTLTVKTKKPVTYQAFAVAWVTPLVLDMNGDGKLEASAGKWLPHISNTNPLYDSSLVPFDIFGNGFEVLMEWVGPNDGLLCIPNPDGTIDGTSLFGNAGGFKDGFEKLSLLDLNENGAIEEKELEPLFVWQDLNINGTPEPREVLSVKEHGITGLYLRHKNYISAFKMKGHTFTMWDWWPNLINVKKVKTLTQE